MAVSEADVLVAQIKRHEDQLWSDWTKTRALATLVEEIEHLQNFLRQVQQAAYILDRHASPAARQEADVLRIYNPPPRPGANRG